MNNNKIETTQTIDSMIYITKHQIIKGVLALLLALLAENVAAQYPLVAPVARDSTVTVSEDRYKVETNRFFDNWFVSAGAGAQLFFGDHNRQMNFADRITPVYEVNFGKWFTPGVGVRFGANGLRVKGVTQNGAYASGGEYPGRPWAGYYLYNQEIEYFHLHADVLFNLTNLFSGYKDNRFYEISTYLGVGWMQATNGLKEKEVSANIGLQHTFRLNSAFYLLVDTRGAMVRDRFDGEEGNQPNDGLLTATAGIGYRFNKRGWDRPSSVKIVERYEDIAEQTALRRKIDALKKQLAEAKDQTVTEVKVEKEVLAAPILITFPIDRWTVSNEVRVNLGFFAELIKKGDPNTKYTITGYADKGTGSVKRNEKVSRERANTIYNVLVDEFGVNPEQLQKEYSGGVDNMFYDDPRLSRAVIVIAK